MSARNIRCDWCGKVIGISYGEYFSVHGDDVEWDEQRREMNEDYEETWDGDIYCRECHEIILREENDD